MYLSHPVLAAIALVVYPQLVASSTSRACYFPDGTSIGFDSPCFPDQPESMCCGQGHSCMSNGLCRWPDYSMPAPLQYIRGSCTDKSWNSTACPRYCEKQSKSAFDPVIGCPGDEYCCELDSGDPGSCCTKGSLFRLPAATTVTVIGASTWVSTTVGIPTALQSGPTGSLSSSTPLSDPVGLTSSSVTVSVVTISSGSSTIAVSASATSTSSISLSGHSTIPLQTTSAVSPTPAVQTKSSGAAMGNHVDFYVALSLFMGITCCLL